MEKKLKMGMIGGGPDAFIGEVHRIAARMDGLIELTCGAFSSDPEKSRETARKLFLPEDQGYSSFEELIIKEAQKPEEDRIDFVSVVTPNHTHFGPASLALEHGFHVVLEKPMTLTLREALDLEKQVKDSGLILALTHTYSGYPMVKQAKAMIAEGKLGAIRKVVVEYPQGWLSRLSELEGNKQAIWRTDPTRSGKSGAMGDIGTHAAHLAEYITGLKIKDICADISIMVPGRKLDDDGNVLLRFNNGARGVLIASQVSAGEENALNIQVYGEQGGLHWHQQEPNSLIIKMLEEPVQVYRTGNTYRHPYALSTYAQHNSRTPSGHPEGLLEAFGNIYRNFALTVDAYKKGVTPAPELLDFPKVSEGVRGMLFIDKVIESSKSNEKWIAFTC